MADAKTTAQNVTADLEATAGRIRELNEKLITAAKQNGNVSLDVYEKTLTDMLSFSQQAADSTQNEVISAITKAHSDYITSITKVFTGAARDALK
ncbi:hypothetical protein FNH13_16605 [Ornithinimicrobium ciconiae]|uniref:Phasin family protein n=1 Tax=Ornithinimicrobium ciconiae TaxID=2594265 RepID=A0A516GE11_9MICO|nr:hypothetical protein [Ornithinimicrobium ciconiae]QDO89756.1 hypothetical protein FNH13_16605 [Ornithinimicrobium ciconiae]